MAEQDVKNMWQGEMDEMKNGKEEDDDHTLTQKHIKTIRAYFDRYDRDQSNSIDISELADFAEALGDPLTRRELDEAFNELDNNGNGKVSFNEFISWWQLS